MASAGTEGLSQDTRGGGDSVAKRTRGRGGRDYALYDPSVDRALYQVVLSAGCRDGAVGRR